MAGIVRGICHPENVLLSRITTVTPNKVLKAMVVILRLALSITEYPPHKVPHTSGGQKPSYSQIRGQRKSWWQVPWQRLAVLFGLSSGAPQLHVASWAKQLATKLPVKRPIQVELSEKARTRSRIPMDSDGFRRCVQNILSRCLQRFVEEMVRSWGFTRIAIHSPQS